MKFFINLMLSIGRRCLPTHTAFMGNWNFQTSVLCLICLFFSDIAPGFSLRELWSYYCEWRTWPSIKLSLQPLPLHEWKAWGILILSEDATSCHGPHTKYLPKCSEWRELSEYFALLAQAWAMTGSNRKFNLKSCGFSRMKLSKKTQNLWVE